MKNRMLLISLLAVAVLACGIPFQALAQGGPGGGASANVELTAKREKAMDRRQELPESGLQKKATTT
jgi:hypothetical protein